MHAAVATCDVLHTASRSVSRIAGRTKGLGRNDVVLGPIVADRGQRMGGRADSSHLVGNLAKKKRDMHFARELKVRGRPNKLAASLGSRWRRGFVKRFSGAAQEAEACGVVKDAGARRQALA